MRNLVDYQSAPYNGPFSISAALLTGVAAAPYEGLWVPIQWAKSGSIELSGTFSAIDVDLYVSNAEQAPANQYVATLGGSATEADHVGITFTSPLISGGKTVSYTVANGNDLTAIGAGLAAAINADTTLAALGITAGAASGVVTVSWPSTSPTEGAGQFSSPSSPSQANDLSLASALSAGATETITFTTGTSGLKLGSTISAAGLTSIATSYRWIKARLTSMTGSSAVANYAGVA
jgi:hypothetical protein